MSKLYLVRHAQVEVIPEAPPTSWHLTQAGITATQRLIAEGNFTNEGVVYHSPEHKARETAAVIADSLGIPMREEEDLRELTADIGWLALEDFKKRVGSYLEGRYDPAFEDYSAATTRIVSCIKTIVARHEGLPPVVVSHGRIICAFLSHILGRRLTKEEWLSISFPDLAVIDADEWRIEKGFLAQAFSI